MHPSPSIEKIPYLSSQIIDCQVLKLDQIHPVISGNKWYKLRYYLKEAKEMGANTIVSFGGPYSNHIVALAYAAKMNGLKCIGYIRRNDGEPITITMQDAILYGMEIINLGRTHFQEKKDEIIASHAKNNNEIYFVDEGGYGILGANGASTIISDWDINNQNSNLKNPIQLYDYIVCAVGTGTMMAGIINAAATHQHLLGIPVLKNEGSIREEIIKLLKNKKANFELNHNFHQGGYAKTTPEQIAFMNQFWNQTKIPSDIVYTGKLFYAVSQLISQNYFKIGSKVLIIHSGGLQGNRSLEKGILDF